MSTHYAAIDIHKTVFQAAVLDSATGEIVSERFPAERGRLREWAERLKAEHRPAHPLDLPTFVVESLQAVAGAGHAQGGLEVGALEPQQRPRCVRAVAHLHPLQAGRGRGGRCAAVQLNPHTMLLA